MLRRQSSVPLSPYLALYDLLIPKDHMLRRMQELVDFSFVYEELQEKYCPDHGRQAIDPVRMFKYLLLKTIYDLSDVDLVERTKVDMSFKFFLDMAPEEDVINPSSLTKFRKLRLQDMNLLDLLIQKTISIAKEQNMLVGTTIIVDATHTKARYNQLKPEEVLRERGKKLRKVMYQVDASIHDRMPAKPPTTATLDEEIAYAQALLHVVDTASSAREVPAVRERWNVLQETVVDDLEKLRCPADPDARVGHKTADTSFFGYKTHLAMSEERLITAAVVTTGEKNDGKQLTTLIEKSVQAGMMVKTVIGDAAYSGKKNIEYSQENNIELIAKLHPQITQGGRKKEDEFEFNKDAGMYVCPAGHMAIRKARTGRKNVGKNQRETYYFDIETCKRCPLQEGCYTEGAKSKTYSTSIPSREHTDQTAFQQSTYFKEKVKERYKIEGKNSELKHRHGYEAATSSGLIGMELQGAMAIFTVNLKRILKLIGTT